MEGGAVRAERGGGEEERRMDGGGRREPRGRMPSCLTNERQTVEAPSTLLTSSFVLHSQPSHAPRLSLFDTQNKLLLKYGAGGLFKTNHTPFIYTGKPESSCVLFFFVIF